jgi:hypothetical protein
MKFTASFYVLASSLSHYSASILRRIREGGGRREWDGGLWHFGTNRARRNPCTTKRAKKNKKRTPEAKCRTKTRTRGNPAVFPYLGESPFIPSLDPKKPDLKPRQWVGEAARANPKKPDLKPG